MRVLVHWVNVVQTYFFLKFADFNCTEGNGRKGKKLKLHLFIYLFIYKTCKALPYIHTKISAIVSFLNFWKLRFTQIKPTLDCVRRICSSLIISLKTQLGTHFLCIVFCDSYCWGLLMFINVSSLFQCLPATSLPVIKEVQLQNLGGLIVLPVWNHSHFTILHM